MVASYSLTYPLEGKCNLNDVQENWLAQDEESRVRNRWLGYKAGEGNSYDDPMLTETVYLVGGNIAAAGARAYDASLPSICLDDVRLGLKGRQCHS